MIILFSKRVRSQAINLSSTQSMSAEQNENNFSYTKFHLFVVFFIADNRVYQGKAAKWWWLFCRCLWSRKDTSGIFYFGNVHKLSFYGFVSTPHRQQYAQNLKIWKKWMNIRSCLDSHRQKSASGHRHARIMLNISRKAENKR